MAYNILKGVVEGSVDQHADQEIGGIKIFKNTISASVFYDTDAQSPCATMKDVAITKIKGAAKNSIIVYDRETGAKSHHNFTYDGEVLHAPIIRGSILEGDAHKLFNLPVDKFVGNISAADINYGLGLHNVRGTLQLELGSGLCFDENRVEVSVGLKSGLSHKNGKLIIEPTRTQPINKDGQNLTDQDVLIVADVSKGTTNSTTLGNLYKNYVEPRIPHASGVSTQIQFKGVSEFESSPNLTFDAASNLLNVEGKIRSDSAHIEGDLRCAGAVRHNIIMVSDNHYDISDSDYTVLCNTGKNQVKVNLPPACNHKGRVLIIKKTDSNKYKITSNVLTISCEEGTIDLSKEIKLKMNYSTRTLQSDGENWWLISAKGT
jgi:hypothetical protein